jgi:GTP-binding protein
VTRARLPLVAVVGRPNVGKSTFVNRVVGRPEAVVDDLPGVTRDRRETQASWNGVRFRLMDTGGIVPGTRDAMEASVLEQARLAIDEAQVILFLVDAREGLTALDREIAESLRPRAGCVLLVANKVDGERQETQAVEAAELGLGNPRPVSAEHGLGMGDLLDEVTARLPRKTQDGNGDRPLTFTLVGRPNVGKSSLANRLLGAPRLVVHPEAGTTRDAVDVAFRYDGTEFVLVDTAGLRRRSHVAAGIEYYSTLRTRKSLERSDVAVLVLDATEPLTAQDARIAALNHDAGKSALLLWNKWDLLPKTTGTSEARARDTRERLPLLAGSPVLFVSALTGLRVRRIPAVVRELAEEWRKRIPTSVLNEVLEEVTSRVHPPVLSTGRPLKFYYAAQVGEAPPSFVVFTNAPKGVTSSYSSYLRNAFRERLGIRAAPIRLSFRARR